MELSTPPPSPPRGACASNEPGSSCSRPPQPGIDRADPLPPNCLLVPLALGKGAVGQARTRTVSCARPRHGTPSTCRRAAGSKANHLGAGHLTRPTTSSRQNCTSNPRAAAQPQLPHGWVQWYQPVAMCSTALHYPSAPCQGTESRARGLPRASAGWRLERGVWREEGCCCSACFRISKNMPVPPQVPPKHAI